MHFQISDENQTIIELLTHTYSSEELDEIEKSNYSYQDLNAKYPVQCVRKSGDIYRIVYESEDKLLLLYYDRYGKTLFQKQVTLNMEKKDFDTVNSEWTVNEVKVLDGAGEYFFLYTGSTDTPKISTHYTTDGHLIQVNYDDDWKVIDVHFEPI